MKRTRSQIIRDGLLGLNVEAYVRDQRCPRCDGELGTYMGIPICVQGSGCNWPAEGGFPVRTCREHGDGVTVTYPKEQRGCPICSSQNEEVGGTDA